ncbi:thiamine phosphate synthase [Sphingomonas aliaeris]|uniref:Thiamine phosphate synthase n=2 Tax=Sphingomonas aliaeris TaxID=2759526 RepID=A0A974NYI3_9SPHN|nr:thiamine phosphate synthase [Sphingomonas aliaeris]
MTDERMGDGLWQALEQLPLGSGVVFRHYATSPAERRVLFARVERVARSRRLVLVRAGLVRLGREQGVHGRYRRQGVTGSGQIRTWPAHDRIEALAGVRAGADLLFASPIFATRSHPGSRGSGAIRAAFRIRGVPVPVIALGGMNEARFRRVRPLGFYGWAAIDAWLGDESKPVRRRPKCMP